ncbi:MAG: UDP-N-acetylmuramate dehydrogenase [Planctomycetes bacterium]|nr:UDP-N-acetylmuramate dehydrogenase [Planctomycetota bacterium]
MRIFQGLEHVVRANEPLAPHTWLRLGGPAEYFAEPTTADELRELLRRCDANGVPVRILGGGSNLLVRDEGVPDLVISVTAPAFTEITVNDRTVTAGGGARLGHVVSTAVREGLAGLESFVGIPGTIGGALKSNTNAQGTDIGQWTAGVVTLTRRGETKTYARDGLQFSYRASNLDDLVILRAEFILDRGEPALLTQRMQQLWIMRKAAQPLASQCAAAVFANPSWASAASLIEQAGLKGTRVGNAEVSDRDPNFLIAHPGASASDVLKLVDILRKTVFDRLGIELETTLEVW